MDLRFFLRFLVYLAISQGLFLVIGWFFMSGASWNPLDYNWFGKILYVIFTIYSLGTALEEAGE